MNSYQVSPEALDGLFKIWDHIALDRVRIANRVEDEFYELFDGAGFRCPP